MRSVRWSNRADKSLASILLYLARRNPEAAHAVTHRIVEAGDALGQHSTGRPGRLPHTYVKSLTDISYILSYRIEGRGAAETIVILDVLHSRRGRLPG